jgi:hypothetical protein
MGGRESDDGLCTVGDADDGVYDDDGSDEAVGRRTRMRLTGGGD